MRSHFARCRVRPIFAITATLVLSLAGCADDDARLASAETNQTPSEPAGSPTPSRSASPIESVEPVPTQAIPSPAPSRTPVVRSRPPAPPAAPPAAPPPPPPEPPPPAPNPPGAPTGNTQGTAVGAPIRIPEFLVHYGKPLSVVNAALESEIRRGCGGTLCVGISVTQRTSSVDACTVESVDFPAGSIRDSSGAGSPQMYVPQGAVVAIVTGTAPCPTPSSSPAP